MLCNLVNCIQSLHNLMGVELLSHYLIICIHRLLLRGDEAPAHRPTDFVSEVTKQQVG